VDAATYDKDLASVRAMLREILDRLDTIQDDIKTLESVVFPS
jgi:hypothetical protein